MDTRRWGPGERLVFELYTKEAHTQTRAWIAQHGIFADTGLSSASYAEFGYLAARRRMSGLGIMACADLCAEIGRRQTRLSITDLHS